jgi:parallel beta-helix repeat protein
MRDLRRNWINHSTVSYSKRFLFFASTLLAACDRMAVPTEPDATGGSLASSNGHTIWVNDDAPAVPPGNGCPHPDYNTIQAAVTAAAAGDRINVCSGTYEEQVTIPAGKDNLWLQSVGRWAAVIKAPPVMSPDPHPVLAYSIVRVEGANNVTILAFTITGPGPGPCGSLHYGVRVASGGSADILGNHIIDIRDTPPPPTLSGCQNGVAVGVGRWVDGTTGSAKIWGNVIERYQKNGPTVDNAGSYADIKHNRILGAGPTPTIAQNGIQASRGATAEIEHNFVFGNSYTGPGASGSGIILYGPGPVVTAHNTLTANDVGINLFDHVPERATCGTAAGSTIAYNRIKASTFDGAALSGNALAACMVTDIQVAHNHSEHNGGPGIGAYDARANDIDNNRIEENDESGILLDNADENRVGNNQVRDNGTPGGDMTDGIRAGFFSSGNIIQKNHLRDNVDHDCHDVGLVDNTWIGNHGETSFPLGLCSRENDDAAFASSTVYGWNPNYPWYEGLALVAEYDWATGYASIDTESLLRLLPAIRVGGIRVSPVSPHR